MSLTLATVTGWRPDELDSAATRLGEAGRVVEAQTRAGCRDVELVASAGSGFWARAAADRAAEELSTGVRLADALAEARDVLAAGATEVGAARTALLDRVAAARAEGFGVSVDGVVTAPTLPPVMTTPEAAAAAAAQRDAAQARLNEHAAAIAADLTGALESVALADQRCADGLTAVTFPQTLWSKVDAYLQRLLASHDLIGSLGAAGAGAATLALTVKNAFTAYGRSSALVRFWTSATAPITDYAAFVKSMDLADDALRELTLGKAGGGVLRFVVGSRAATAIGKIALPLTVVTGLVDVVTGGGYDGARGWATRGFGLAGAAGAGALLASSAGLLALGPIGVGIAGAAVIGYGLWSAGNLVYDHWDDITAFASGAAEWTGDRLSDAAGAVSDAADWAGDRLADAGDGLLDMGGSVVGAIGGLFG